MAIEVDRQGYKELAAATSGLFRVSPLPEAHLLIMGKAAKSKSPKTPQAPLARSIGKAGRAKSYHRRGLWAIKKKNGGKVGLLRHTQRAHLG